MNKKNRKALIGFGLGIVFLLGACTSKKAHLSHVYSEDILINQLGYETGAEKKALIRASATSFQLLNNDGEVVFEGKTGIPKYWELSGDTVRVADFSGFEEEGAYYLRVNKSELSYPFKIGSGLYSELSDAALKSYYYARCGVDIEEKYGGKWNWKAGHPDTAVMVHISAADENRPEGTTFSSVGGWYDAGDYGKYIVNSGITTWTLLQSCALYEDYHTKQNLHIPESGNSYPDILDESLVNLKWMMTMQDSNDGGLYHKLTTKAFDGFIMPEETSKQRYVVQKTTSAALDYASTLATASRLLCKYEMTDLAEKMKESAIHAWEWAVKNPNIFYLQPNDISTGAYGDTCFIDEWFWASAEMYLLTGEQTYKETMMRNYQKPVTPKWDVVNALGVISLLTSEKRNEFKEFEDDFLTYANEMLEKEKACPYLISTGKFAWGSNSDVLNDGMLKLVAYKLTGKEDYKVSARNDLHYILGRNATGYLFITGFGGKSPMQPHNRIMAADGVEEPVPGYIVGGPNTVVLNDCEHENVERSTYPAASYSDLQCSYSTNETAINWNAPLVLLLAGLAK